MAQKVVIKTGITKASIKVEAAGCDITVFSYSEPKKVLVQGKGIVKSGS